MDLRAVGPPSLPFAMEGMAAALGPDGLIYVMGGANYAPTIYRTLYSYDPATAGAAWVKQENMPTPRANLAAVTGPDGLIYAIGGGIPWDLSTMSKPTRLMRPRRRPTRTSATAPIRARTSSWSTSVHEHGCADRRRARRRLGHAVDPELNYTLQCVVYNDANVAAPNTKVRFWHFPGGVGAAGALISEQTVTVPANGSIVVTSSNPFQSGAAGAHECAAVSIANAQSPYFNVDPTTATAVIDPTVPHPAGSGHFGSAWRNTNSVAIGGEIKIWNFPFVANLGGIEPARVKLTATATKVAADWDRTDEIVKLRKVVEGACSDCRLPLFLIPEIRAHLPLADCDLRIRVPGDNDEGARARAAGAEHHARSNPVRTRRSKCQAELPDDAQARRHLPHQCRGALSRCGRRRKEAAVEYLEVIYVKT